MTDNARRLEELDRLADRISADIHQFVRELLVDDGVVPRFVVAERLLRVGSSFDSALESLQRDERADADVAAQAALLAFATGSREWPVQVLFDEIEHGGEWARLAAVRLAQAHVAGVCGAVLGALRNTDAGDFDAIVGWLDALRIGGCDLPAAERAKLASNPHWQVTTAVAEWFPSESC